MAVLGPVEVVGVPELCTQLCAATRLWAAPRVVTTLWSVLLLLLRSLSLAARKSEPRGVTLHCVSTVSVALGGKMGMTDPGQQELDSCSISPQPTSQLSFQDSIFSLNLILKNGNLHYTSFSKVEILKSSLLSLLEGVINPILQSETSARLSKDSAISLSVCEGIPESTCVCVSVCICVCVSGRQTLSSVREVSG